MGNSQLRGHDMGNKLTFAAATTALVLGASAASAQSIPFAEVDTDGDMMLSNDELVAAFGADGAAILMEDDSDGDTMLSVQEIRIATGMSMATEPSPMMTKIRITATPPNPRSKRTIPRPKASSKRVKTATAKAMRTTVSNARGRQGKKNTKRKKN